MKNKKGLIIRLLIVVAICGTFIAVAYGTVLKKDADYNMVTSYDVMNVVTYDNVVDFKDTTDDGKTVLPTAVPEMTAAPTAVPTVKPTATATPEIAPEDNAIGGALDFFNSEVAPLVTGILTGLMTILALIVPYVKTLGKLKSTQSAYATVYDQHEKLIGLAKEFDSDNVKNYIIEQVLAEVSNTFEKYDNTLSGVLGQNEIMSAQLTSLIEGAKLAWKEAEGAQIVLAKTPTASVVERQSLAIDFLKTLIGKELGLKRTELESRMTKELRL